MSCTRERVDRFHTSMIKVDILRECNNRIKRQSEDSSYAVAILHLRGASARHSRFAVGKSEAGMA